MLAGVAGTVYAVGGIIATPLVAMLGTRFGKRRTMIGGLSMVVVANILHWHLYTPAAPYLSLICMGMMAPGMSCFWILIGSMIADICDIDELDSGLRREGMYAAIYSFLLKIAISAVFAISGFLVTWTGVDPELAGAQTPETIFWMRFLFTIVPAAFVGLALIMCFYYPITEKRVREVHQILKQRRQCP